MTRFVSQKNPISVNALKRKPQGSIVTRHYGRVDIRFARCIGGWRIEREDSVWLWPPVIVSSYYVARECNKAVGCKESWAKVY